MHRADHLALVHEHPRKIPSTVTHRVNLLRINAARVAKDPAEPVRWRRMAADAGKAEAQYKLACAYYDGEDLPRNVDDAVRWWGKAAEQGHGLALQALAAVCRSAEVSNRVAAVRWLRKAAFAGGRESQFALACAYARGEGVAKHPGKALRWLRKAAVQGLAEAQFAIACAYDKGEGVARDPAEAVRWCRMAADSGNAEAQYRLACAYDNGEGVTKDPAEALHWCRMAADFGHPEAQYEVACAHRDGQGVIQSDVLAAMWFKRACLRFLQIGERERASECVESVRRLPGQLYLGLVLELEGSVSGERTHQG